jgi:hypothetical protein
VIATRGETDYVEGVYGIRNCFPGSSVRCGATPKDDGRGKMVRGVRREK